MTTTTFGTRGFGSTNYHGLVKIKLVHTLGASLIVPDQIYLESPCIWFQPKSFQSSRPIKDGDAIHCKLTCDLDNDYVLRIEFTNRDLIQDLPDGSFLYKCQIIGPDDLTDRSTGEWEMRHDHPHLRLFHHTDAIGQSGITSSGEFWASPWNIQGTRELANVGYVYFTNLADIRTEADLAAIAMNPRSKLRYLRDGVPAPTSLPPDWKETNFANDVLEIDVYWSAPNKRDHTVKAYVDSTLIAPSHILRHENRVVWFEVSCPSIYRVGVEPKQTIAFDGRYIDPRGNQKIFDYMVIGDATTIAGLGAPLDEENTKAVFRVHRISEPPLEFWVNNPNQDHFPELPTEEQEFES